MEEIASANGVAVSELVDQLSGSGRTELSLPERTDAARRIAASFQRIGWTLHSNRQGVVSMRTDPQNPIGALGPLYLPVALLIALFGRTETLDIAVADSGKVELTKGHDKYRSHDQGVRNMWIGAVVAIIGLLVTLVTYSAANPGDSYIIAWGAMVFGAIQFVAGVAQSR